MWTGTEAILLGGYVASGSASSQVARGSVTTDAIVHYGPEGTSVAAARLPSPRGGAAAVWTGTHAYLFGGSSDADSYSDQVVRYDPSTGSVEVRKARLPTGRDWLSAAWDPAVTADCPAGCAYLFGGARHYSAYTEVLRYDAGRDRMTGTGHHLPSARAATSAFFDPSVAPDCPAGCAYVLGGHYADYNLDEVVRYDPRSGAMDVVARIPVPRGDFGLAWDGKHAYLFGGHKYEPKTLFLPDILRFTPGDGAFVAVCGVLPEGRGYAAAVWADDRAYVLGGATPRSEPVDTVLEYRPGVGLLLRQATLHIEPGSDADTCAANPCRLAEPTVTAVPRAGLPRLEGAASYFDLEATAPCPSGRVRIDVKALDGAGAEGAALFLFDGHAWVGLEEAARRGNGAVEVYEASYDPATRSVTAVVSEGGAFAWMPAGDGHAARASSAPALVALLALALAGVLRQRSSSGA